MTTKKIMGIVALVIVVGVVFLIFIIYATVKTKSTSLNQYEPYKEWIGKTVTLNKETVLFKEKNGVYNNRQYPYVLLDSLHPQWQYVEERTTMAAPDLEEIVRFPAGTTFKIDKAIQYTGGVSGSSYPTLFGTITTNGNTYKIGYQWGQRNQSKMYEKIEECWEVHQAPWQDKIDTGFYALPTAKFW